MEGSGGAPFHGIELKVGVMDTRWRHLVTGSRFFLFPFSFSFFLNFYCLELSLSRILVALLPDLIALGGKCHWNGNEQRHPRRFDLFLSVVAGREAPPCRQRHLTIDSEFFFPILSIGGVQQRRGRFNIFSNCVRVISKC